MADPQNKSCDFPHVKKETLTLISELDHTYAEISCEINSTRKCVKHVCEGIVDLSKEIEDSLLREKWASRLKGDEGDCKQQSPIEDSLAICRELEDKPECTEGVLKALKQKQASLEDNVSSLRRALEEVDAT